MYTYDMLNAGIDRDTLMSINEEQLLYECGIKNKIHRLKIQQGVKEVSALTCTENSFPHYSSTQAFLCDIV